MKKNLLKSLLVAAVMMIGMSTASYAQFQNFENKTHTPEAQPFADLSQKIWDLMAEKNADALKEIFHPNAMFVHMGGYWGTEQELATIGGGFIHYKQADVYGVDVKQINENNWAVYSTIGCRTWWRTRWWQRCDYSVLRNPDIYQREWQMVAHRFCVHDTYGWPWS